MSEVLKQIDHIVVLMLENRSFDHMLGYLSLTGGRAGVDGLNGAQSNTFNGTAYPAQLRSTSVFTPDPHHEWNNVAVQLQNNNGGFIQDFATRDPNTPWRIMDCQNAADVPIYDHLSKEFTICDRWFSSLPGATQPNRMYALAGHSNGKKNNLSSAQLLAIGWKVRPIFEFLPANVSWRAYSHDISTLRFIKGYRGIVPEIDKINKFFDRVAEGTLPNVSWIDPSFDILQGIYPGPPNDDHPPHDVRNGQNLVRKVYNALVNGPREQFEKTLFVVVYDEHGGFYDHVSPQQWTPEDDRAEFKRYGVRVPAFIVSPWAKRGGCIGSADGAIFDHTSVLNTILRRFSADAGGNIPQVSARVTAARDLSYMLTETSARTDFTPAPGLPFEISWEDRFEMLETVSDGVRENRIQKRLPSDLQQSLEALAHKVIGQGVPPDKL